MRLLSRTAWRSITTSNQPGPAAAPGVGAELVAPLDEPVADVALGRPMAARSGTGPDPTRVTYALAMPITRSMWRGPTPAPAQAPPATGFDEVTNG